MGAPSDEEFADLYRSHRGAVYRTLLRDLRHREDAEDVTQTAFLQAYRAYERGSRPDRPRAWLLTIADNVRRRRYAQRRRLEEVPFDEAVGARVPPDSSAGELRDAIARLPSSQRSALVLREVAGLSYREIADDLRTSVGAVQMLLFRARRSVRDELAAASRRGLAALPTWITNLLPGVDRLVVPARVAGAGLAVAAATAIVASGAETAPPVQAAEPRARQAHAQPTAPVARPRVTRADVEPDPRARSRPASRDRTRVATPPAPAAPPAVEHVPATSPLPSVASERAPAQVRLPAPLPPLDVPSLPTASEVRVPPIALPELPLAPVPPLPEAPEVPVPPVAAPELPLPPEVPVPPVAAAELPPAPVPELPAVPVPEPPPVEGALPP